MMEKTRLSIVGNVIFAVLIMISAILLLTIKCSPYIFKTIASVLFVLCGAFNFWYVVSVMKIRRNIPFFISMMCGLVFACLGDILLIDHFVIGAGLFGIGHILFFVSFVCLSGFRLRDFFVGLGIFAVVLLLVLMGSFFDFGDKKMLVIIYGFVISFMLGKAVSNVFDTENRRVSVFIMIGALLFFVSDFMLMIYLFAGKILIFDIICIMTYYPAEIILALSILYVAKNFCGRSLEIEDFRELKRQPDDLDANEEQN